MLAALVRFSLTQRLLLLVLTVMLVGAGVPACPSTPFPTSRRPRSRSS
jgi:cobalt-zinc-cadmium resistance protein CzcA